MEKKKKKLLPPNQPLHKTCLPEAEAELVEVPESKSNSGVPIKPCISHFNALKGHQKDLIYKQARLEEIWAISKYH